MSELDLLLLQFALACAVSAGLGLLALQSLLAQTVGVRLP